MIIEITRNELRIKPTDQPMDDIFIEEVLGLCKEGDYVKLVRVSNKPVSPYVLETELVLIDDDSEGTEEVISGDSSGATPGPTPLPCPFCGKYPKIITCVPEHPGDIRGKIVCLNPHCPAQPEVEDTRRFPDSIGEEPFRSALISQWNARPANAKPC